MRWFQSSIDGGIVKIFDGGAAEVAGDSESLWIQYRGEVDRVCRSSLRGLPLTKLGPGISWIRTPCLHLYKKNIASTE